MTKYSIAEEALNTIKSNFRKIEGSSIPGFVFQHIENSLDILTDYINCPEDEVSSNLKMHFDIPNSKDSSIRILSVVMQALSDKFIDDKERKAILNFVNARYGE